MITIKTNVANCGKWLDDKAMRQIPFIKALALTRTGKIVKTGILEVLKNRLDRPTPYTLNSLYLTPAKKHDANPFARVWFKDYAGKGTPAVDYLYPETHGGLRKQKRFERALIAKGMMASNEYAIPAKGIRLDAYGNVPRGTIVKIMSAVKAFAEQGYDANRTNSKRSQRKVAGANYFVSTTAKPGRGIWERKDFGHGHGIRPVFLFVKKPPRYRVRVPFDTITENMVNKHLPLEFNRAFKEVIG